MQPWQGGARWQQELTLTVPANGSQMIAEISRADLTGLLGLDSVLVCDVNTNLGADRAWYFSGLPHEMKLPPATLAITQQHHGGSRGTVTIQTDHYARVVTLEADVDFADNYFDLLPGETRSIDWKTASDQRVEDVTVYCWNGRGCHG